MAVLEIQVLCVRKQLMSMLRMTWGGVIVGYVMIACPVLIACKELLPAIPLLRVFVGGMLFFGCVGILLYRRKEPFIYSAVSDLRRRLFSAEETEL